MDYELPVVLLQEIVSNHGLKPTEMPRPVLRSGPESALVVQIPQALNHFLLGRARGRVHYINDDGTQPSPNRLGFSLRI